MLETRTGRTVLRLAVVVLSAAPFLYADVPDARAASVTFSDGDFDPADWDERLVLFGNGGEHGLIEHPTGGATGGYLQIDLSLNGAGSGERSQVDLFYINTTAVYDPSVDGEITRLDYFERAISLDGVGAGMRLAPALRQGGQLFFAPEPARFGMETAWTYKEMLGLTEADFRTAASGAVQPDFSTSGGPIEFGFFRAVSNVENTPRSTRSSGIDDWRIDVNPTAPPVRLDEIRAEVETSRRPFVASSAVISAMDVEARQPQSLADRVEAVANHGDFTRRTGARAHSSLAGGLGCFARARGPIANLGGDVVAQAATARASHVRRFTAVADGSAPPGLAGIDIVNLVDGTLDLDAAQGVGFGSATVIVRTSVEVFTGAGRVGSYSREAVLGAGAANTRALSAHVGWRDFFTLDPTPDGAGPDAVLAYAEAVNDVAFVPVGDDFSIEFALEVEALCNLGSAGWVATADFENTAKFEIATDTPGVRLAEIHAEDGFDDPATSLSGRSRTRFRRFARSRDAARMGLSLGDGTFRAEDDLGSSLRGSLEPIGKSGRRFRLRPDEASVGELLEGLARRLSNAKERTVVVSLRGEPPVGTLVLNRRRTRARLALAVRVVAEVDGVTKPGLYRVLLRGPAPRGE